MNEPGYRRIFEGVLLGTAVGDALGLPAENMSPGRIRKRWGGEWRMRLVLGRGMVSDDTEHTLLVAQALLEEPEDAARFQRLLAWKLRWWFAALPGGVGLATARACLRLWMGISPERSGVKSAGSGPAMRSAIIGAYFSGDADRRRAFTLASARLTHHGWQAESAALAVAEAAALAAIGACDPAEIFPRLRALSVEEEWRQCLARMESALEGNASVPEFATAMGLQRGVTGYALHVVPVALFSWMRHGGDFKGAMCAALDCGGDTDTVGAVLGGVCGASAGVTGIPEDWLIDLFDWPRGKGFMRAVAGRLADQCARKIRIGAAASFWPGVIVRNLFFLMVVLLHGLRRLLPPY